MVADRLQRNEAELSDESEPVQVTVVIPTVGRPDLLRACLQSLAECGPRADEIVVVDQSGGGAITAVVSEFSETGARVCADDGRGRGRAVNRGIAAARGDLVLVTDDDCTVARDWIGAAQALAARHPGYIITGRVLLVGDSTLVPSTMAQEQPEDYTGTRARSVLYAGNMACARHAWLGFGGFDERILPSAEDNDLCYRWLKAGRGLRYEPDLTVWHHAWRTPEQLRDLYRGYARGDGFFYGKQLRAGELRVLSYLLSDLRGALRGHAASVLRRSPRGPDPRLAVLPSMLHGLRDGWRNASTS